MTDRVIRQTLLFQALLAVLVVLGSWAFLSWQHAVAALAASLVSIVDVWGLARLVGTLLQKKTRNRWVVGVLLGLKFPALIVVVYVLLRVAHLDVVGLILGFSTLVVAVFVGGLFAAVGAEE